MCDLCKQKDLTIEAQAETISALTELVNLQRAIPQAPAVPIAGEGTLTRESLLGPETADEEEIMARLRAGVDDNDTADRLLAQLQVVHSPQE